MPASIPCVGLRQFHPEAPVDASPVPAHHGMKPRMNPVRRIMVAAVAMLGIAATVHAACAGPLGSLSLSYAYHDPLSLADTPRTLGKTDAQ